MNGAEQLFSMQIMISYIPKYLSLADIYMLGGICQSFRKKIRTNDEFWKKIIRVRCISNLWDEIDIDHNDRIMIAVNHEHTLPKELRRLYIMNRLSLPMSSKSALRVYIEITTPKLPAPQDKTILVGSIVAVDTEEDNGNKVRTFNKLSGIIKRSQEKSLISSHSREELVNSRGDITNSSELSTSGEPLTKSDGGESNNKKITRKPKRVMVYRLVFKRADGKPFHIWSGDGYHSDFRYYTVDRQSRTINTLTSEFSRCAYNRTTTKTVLSKADHINIAAILKTDIPKEAESKISVPIDRDVNNDRNDGDNVVVERRADPIGDGINRGILKYKNLFDLRAHLAEPEVKAYLEWTIDVDFDKWFSQLYYNGTLTQTQPDLITVPKVDTNSSDDEDDKLSESA